MPLLCCISTLAAHAGGVFIFNQSASHPESSSKAFRYNTIRRQGEVTTFLLPTGERVKVTKFQPLAVFEDVDLRAYPTITSDNAPEFSRMLAEYQAASKKYPNATRLLQEDISELTSIVLNLRSGNEWAEGAWMSRTEVSQLRAKRQQEAISKELENQNRKKQAERNTRISDLRHELNSAREQLKSLTDKKTELEQQRDSAVKQAVGIVKKLQQSSQE